MANVNILDYPCSQGDLYSALETAWGNYGVHLTRFTAFKALYTLAYKTTAMTAIATAKAMPDDDAKFVNQVEEYDDGLEDGMKYIGQ